MGADAIGLLESRFLDPLDVRQVGWRDGRPVWMTLAPLRYRSALLGGAVLLVPTEFVTDGASVPRLPLAYLLAGGKGNRSSVIHDFPYQFGYWLLDGGGRLEATKRVSDAVFGESLPTDPMSGAGPWAAGAMLAFVRAFGRGAWAEALRRSGALNPEWTALGVPQA